MASPESSPPDPIRVDHTWTRVSGEFMTMSGALGGILPLARTHAIASVFIEWNESLGRWKVSVLIHEPADKT